MFLASSITIGCLGTLGAHSRDEGMSVAETKKASLAPWVNLVSILPRLQGSCHTSVCSKSPRGRCGWSPHGFHTLQAASVTTRLPTEGAVSCRREPREGIIQAAAKAKERPLRWSVCAGCVLGYSASCTRLKECFSPSHLDAVPSFNRYLLAVCQGLGSSA